MQAWHPKHMPLTALSITGFPFCDDVHSSFQENAFLMLQLLFLEKFMTGTKC